MLTRGPEAELPRGVAEEGMAVLLVEHDIGLVMDLCASVHVMGVRAASLFPYIEHEEGKLSPQKFSRVSCNCFYSILQLSTLTLSLSLPGRGQHERSEGG